MSSFKLTMTRKDPLQTDFILLPSDRDRDRARTVLYTSDTAHYHRPLNGARAVTTITRKDPSGDRFQVGVIEWPVQSNERARLVVGTRAVEMIKTGVYTAPERFTAMDGFVYEWQMYNSRPQLVPLWSNHFSVLDRIATFVQTKSGFFLMRKQTSSLLIPLEATHILDDIVVTFIYFEAKGREKESGKFRNSWSGSLM